MTENNRATVVGLGEILWDVFPDGPRFGGAPANFACTAAGVGGAAVHVAMVSGVGNDDLGRDALRELREHGVDTAHVAVRQQPTGQVLVTLDSEGRASYEFAPDAAWDNLDWNPGLATLAAQADAVCFGTLGQRSAASRDTIQQFVAATPTTTLRVFDVNVRQPFVNEQVVLDSLKLANVLKLNDDELPLLAGWAGLQGSNVELLQQLAEKFSLRVVALTRGGAGAMLIAGDDVDEFGGMKTQVVDTVGAGDAFTAALTLGLLNGEELADINRAACELAAYVCSQPGATPAIPPWMAR